VLQHRSDSFVESTFPAVEHLAEHGMFESFSHRLVMIFISDSQYQT
jgi:hypothetical protein